MLRAPVCSVRQPRAANNTGRLSTSTAKTSQGASPTEGHFPPAELQCGNKVPDNAHIAKEVIPRFDRGSVSVMAVRKVRRNRVAGFGGCAAGSDNASLDCGVCGNPRVTRLHGGQRLTNYSVGPVRYRRGLPITPSSQSQSQRALACPAQDRRDCTA